MQMTDQEQNVDQEQIVEYEIVDENGNQILINDAQNLKSLATSMSEVRQPDGSIVKEYILNDPKIIEQIRDKIKSDSMGNLLADKQSAAQETKPDSIYQNHYSTSTNFEQTKSQVPLNKLGGLNQASAVKKDSSGLLKKNLNQSFDNLSRILSQNSIKNKNNNKTPSPPASRLTKNPSTYSSATTATTIIANQPQAPPPPLPPFLNQVKETIKKFQENATTTATGKKSPSKNVKQQNEKETFKKFVSSNSFTEFLEAEKKRLQGSTKPQEIGNNLNRSKEQVEFPKPLKFRLSPQLINQDNIRRINKNKFEIRTKKGKSVQFTITSEDPTDSEIEECKTILNRSYDNLLTIDNNRSPRKEYEQINNNLRPSESAKNMHSSMFRTEEIYDRQRKLEPTKQSPSYSSFSKIIENQSTHSIVAPKVLNKCAETKKCFNENRQIIIEASMNKKK